MTGGGSLSRGRETLTLRQPKEGEGAKTSQVRVGCAWHPWARSGEAGRSNQCEQHGACQQDEFLGPELTGKWGLEGPVTCEGTGKGD